MLDIIKVMILTVVDGVMMLSLLFRDLVINRSLLFKNKVLAKRIAHGILLILAMGIVIGLAVWFIGLSTNSKVIVFCSAFIIIHTYIEAE